MRVVYPICCGIDVHKSFLVATLITTRTGELTPKYEKRRFSTFNRQILEMKNWLLENNCHHVCMESTGKYWVPVYNLLEDDINVVIANPKWVQAIKGNKDDVKDSKWIGDLFRFGMVPGSFIPDKDIRILREFTRYRYKITCMKSSEKNRLQNALTVCNIGLDSVVSDMFGVSSTKIRNYLLQTDEFDPDHCVSLLHGRMKSKSEQIIEAIEGYQFDPVQKTRIRFVDDHMTYLDQLLQKIDEQLSTLVQPLEPAIKLLCSIPGVKRKSAIYILSEIGTDMKQFSSSKRLCSWAGLTPGSNESAGKKKSVRISRAGVYLKPALVQCAHAAVKDKKNPYYALKYQRIYKRRGKKRAIIAIARMMLTAVYQMLKSGELWNPTDLFKIDMPTELVEKQKRKAIKQAVKFLYSEGILEHLQLDPSFA